MARLIAIYDACVLYPAPLRDFLMQVAVTGLFQAKWTNRIHDEWIGNLLENRPDLEREQLEKTRRLMNTAVPDCLIDGYEGLIKSIKLPDEDDRHVLASAIHAHATVIVTFNLKDFPLNRLRPHGMEAVHPDDFLTRLIEEDSAAISHAAQLHRARLRNPPRSVDEYLLTLSSQGLVKTAQYLRSVLRQN